MICGSGGVEMGTTLGERAGDVTIGARDGLVSTLRYGATRRVGVVVVCTGATVGVMAVVKRRESSARERSVSSPTVAKGEAGAVLNSVSARVLEARVATSTKEGAGMTHWCGKNFTVLATRSVRVF